jgi:hypothetical protein
MKMIAITVTLAVVLGVAVMLAPVLAFTYIYPAVVPMDKTGLSGGKENNQSASPANETYGTGSYSFNRTPEAIAEAAQELGTLDTGPAPFPSSILQAVPVVATGFVTALVALLILKWKRS